MTLTGDVGPTQASSADLFVQTLRGEPSVVHGLADHPWEVPLSRWTQDADEVDDALLSRCVGPTLDVGCGPGRMTHALALKGVCALGLDVLEEAVAQTRARGGSAIRRDVFHSVPGEGRWGTVLLADGNIGIGGDPVRLLRRAAGLLCPDGRVVVDLAAPGIGVGARLLRLEVGNRCSEPFPWGFLAPEAVPQIAALTGFRAEVRREGSRWFAQLEPERARCRP